MHLVGKGSIIIGIDVHKYIHQAVALSCFGEELGKLQFSNVVENTLAMCCCTRVL
jgi:hypothetical protein